MSLIPLRIWFGSFELLGISCLTDVSIVVADKNVCFHCDPSVGTYSFDRVSNFIDHQSKHNSMRIKFVLRMQCRLCFCSENIVRIFECGQCSSLV